MNELTRKTSLGMAGLLLLTALSGMTTASTRSDLGANEWCPDAQDNDFLLPGNPSGSDTTCDGNTADTDATITGSSTLAINCVDNPTGTGSAADTRCTGGALSFSDAVFNRGELEDPAADWPLATGVSVSLMSGPSLRVDYRVCFVLIADGTDAGCKDTFVNPFPSATCLTTASNTVATAVDMVATVGGAPVGAMPDAAYIFWANVLNPAAFNVPSLTACGNNDVSDRVVKFRWAYDTVGAGGANAGAGLSVNAVVVPLSYQKFLDGCAPIYTATASWAGPVAGMAGAWLIPDSQPFAGWASEVEGAGPQATSLSDTGFITYGDSATVVAFAYAVDEAGAIAYSATEPCEPPQCMDPAEQETPPGTDGGAFPADPNCSDILDDDETNGSGPTPPGTTECSDQVDNEATPDGQVDWPFDAECTDPLDNDETTL